MAEEVIGEILWTDSAKKSFNKIIEYLETNWTEREVSKFILSLPAKKKAGCSVVLLES